MISSDLATVAFQNECQALGLACAKARMRPDERGPEDYLTAFADYQGPKDFPAYFVRKWLSLRLSAIKRGMVVDQSVTPKFLERVTDGSCPVTLEKIEFNSKSPHNPSVDRLVNDVTYMAGNICVLSIRANRAKADKSFEQVAKLAESGQYAEGLEAVEWMRLASLMYGAWSRGVKKSDPYLLPLAAMPGPSMFSSTSQVVQLLLTRHCTSIQGQDALGYWLALTKEADGNTSQFEAFFSHLEAAIQAEPHAGNAWLHGDVFQEFVEWYRRCQSSVVPAVETLLRRNQLRDDAGVTNLPWQSTERARR
ncbi:MAG: hypothetical protein ABI351_01535 [Herbaspirillum sp.]